MTPERPKTITTSVLVIDHNAILLEGICCLISAEPDMVVGGTASNLQDGLERAARAHFDCVLVDLDIHSEGIFEAFVRIRKSDPTVIIIGLITYELDDRVSEALASGASAVIGKDQISRDLVNLIRHTS